MNKEERPYFIMFIISNLIFGLNGTIASFIHLNSYEIVFFRTAIGSLSLLLLFLLSKGKFTFFKYKKDLLFLCVSGISMGASWLFLFEAYARMGVSLSVICYYVGPVIVMALSPLLFKEKLSTKTIIGFVAVLIGIFLINFNAVNEKSDVLGVVFGLLAAVTYSFMVIFNKKAKNITGLENSALQLLISFVTVGLFLIIKQGFTLKVQTSDILPILEIGIVGTGLGCFFYFSSIKKISVQKVSIFGYVEPLSTILFSLIFLKESMLPVQIIGAVLILGGAMFSEFTNLKKQKKA